MKTEVIFVLDASGSMSRLTNDTVEGFNGFVEKQKDDTKTTITTVLFNTNSWTLHDGIDVYEISPMTDKEYRAGGSTALLDAIGDTINKVQDRHDNMDKDKPDNVLFVITTDGEENSSRRFNKSQIQKMIKHQTNGHGWEFIFMGANMDAVQEANDIGISATKAVNYDWTSQGTDALWGTVSTMACSVKASSSDALDLASVYTDALDSALKTTNDIAIETKLR